MQRMLGEADIRIDQNVGQALSLSSKAKLISAYTFGTSCLLFLVTL